jgi:hypothetical protein
MSTEKDRSSESPSYRERLPLLKVDLCGKGLPLDFFPKTLSQSPAKRSRQSISGEVLADWYERESSPPQRRLQFCRVAHQPMAPTREGKHLAVREGRQARENKAVTKEIRPLQRIKELPSEEERANAPARSVVQCNPSGVAIRGRPRQRTHAPHTPQGESRPLECRPAGELRRVRMIRSESHGRRSAKSPSPGQGGQAGQVGEWRRPFKVREVRRSLRELPCWRQEGGVGVGFDGLVTFNRYGE